MGKEKKETSTADDAYTGVRTSGPENYEIKSMEKE